MQVDPELNDVMISNASKMSLPNDDHDSPANFNAAKECNNMGQLQAAAFITFQKLLQLI